MKVETIDHRRAKRGYTLETWANYLEKKPETLNRWIKSGKLVCVQPENGTRRALYRLAWAQLMLDL